MYLTNEFNVNLDSLFHLFKYLKKYESTLIETTIKDFNHTIKELRSIH